MKRIMKVVAVTLMSFCLVLPLGINVQAAGTDIVYIAPTGEKYHKQNCSTLSRSKHLTQLTVDEALARGYTPCKVCSLVVQLPLRLLLYRQLLYRQLLQPRLPQHPTQLSRQIRLFRMPTRYMYSMDLIPMMQCLAFRVFFRK